MKNQKLILLAALIASISRINAQGGTPTNNSAFGGFLGFNIGPNVPLQVRNDFNNQIRFFTGTNFAGLPRERMRIFEGPGLSPSCPLGGGVGINATPNAPITVPASMLHIGTSLTAGGGITPVSIGAAGWRNWMQLGTFMHDISDNMYIGLKLEQTSPLGAGNRMDAVINWGDDFTTPFIPNPGPDYLRFIFTGSYTGAGANTTPANTAGNVNGLEVVRIAPVGNMGIGNFYNNPNFPFQTPARRLEILSDKTAVNLNGNPQVRITHTQQNPAALVTTGLFTDLETTNNGDLSIGTFNNTLLNTPNRFFKQRYVGIHTNTPGNTLEINSQFALATTPNAQPAAPTFAAPTGWAGLRFTDLTSNSIPQLNPGSGVLSIDGSGDVIYVPSNSIVNSNNGIVISPANLIQLGSDCNTTSAVQKSAQGILSNRFLHLNGNNFVFGDGGRVGIGMPPANGGAPCINVNNKLEIQSTIGNPYFGTAFGASGLRFTILTSTDTPVPNGFNGVNSNNALTVDANGDVVLTTVSNVTSANNGLQVSGGNVQLGGNCAIAAEVTAAGLLTDRKIRMNGFNFIFSDNPLNRGRVGIGDFGPGQCLPGNLLEVRLVQGIPNSTSGLRLTDLAGAIPLPFNNQVLSVNPLNGDVILTNGPAPATNLGGLCGSGANPLATNWEIPLNNNNFIFGGQGGTNNNVGIGTTCAPIAKLDVLQNSGNFGSIGINVENQDAAGGTPGVTDVIGVKSLMSNPAPGCSQIAGWFEAVGGGGCVGAPQAHAIYVPQNGGGISIGYPNPAAVGFGSLLDVNGTISAAGITYPSDATLKNSVTNIANSLATIKKLRPVTYNWNTPLSPDMAGLHAGFIAQEVDTVLPHLVKTNPASGKKSVAYTELIPYLVKAIQQLEKQNHTQDSLITALTGSVNSCCSNSAVRLTGISGGVINQQNINLSDADVIVLNQNTPNPFAEQTTITYNVPAKYKFAQIIFKTIEGKIIRTVDITTKGKGQLNVFASDLSAGLYVYSLIVDGEVIDTKKMVKE